MAEIGLIASVIQVAGAGLKLSQTLYQYAETVASADRRVKDIAAEVKHTSDVIKELGEIFRQDQTSTLLSRSALRTADETIQKCSTVFTELDVALQKTKKNTIGRLMLPFRESKIDLLRSHIDKLTSTLQLLMQVLIHAHQVASQKLNREAEAAQREEIKALLKKKNTATKRYEQSVMDYTSENSEVENDSTLVSMRSSTVSVAQVETTVTAEKLGECLQHVQSLLQNIQILQKALSTAEVTEHSEHQQRLIGSYFNARTHLDSVLLGNPQAPEYSSSERSTRSREKSQSSLALRHTLTGSTLQTTESHILENTAALMVTLDNSISDNEPNKAIEQASEMRRNEERAILALETEKRKQFMERLKAEELKAVKAKSEDEKNLSTIHTRLQVEAERKAMEEELVNLERAKQGSDEEDAKSGADKGAAALASSEDVNPFQVQSYIDFKDAIGRKFHFPYHLCNTWQSMYGLIKQAFFHVESLNEHVSAGRFDLIGPEGDVILPTSYDRVLRPGWTITMRMQTLPELQEKSPVPTRPSSTVSIEGTPAMQRRSAPVTNDQEWISERRKASNVNRVEDTVKTSIGPPLDSNTTEQYPLDPRGSVTFQSSRSERNKPSPRRSPQPVSSSGDRIGRTPAYVYDQPALQTLSNLHSSSPALSSRRAYEEELSSPEYDIINEGYSQSGPHKIGSRVDPSHTVANEKTSQSITLSASKNNMNASKESRGKEDTQLLAESTEGLPLEQADVDTHPLPFENDIEFTGTIATGLQEFGFHNDIVINDPSLLHRLSSRDSERTSTSDPTASQPEISTEEHGQVGKQRPDESVTDKTNVAVLEPSVLEPIEQESVEDDWPMFSPHKYGKKKKGKKGKKGKTIDNMQVEEDAQYYNPRGRPPVSTLRTSSPRRRPLSYQSARINDTPGVLQQDITQRTANTMLQILRQDHSEISGSEAGGIAIHDPRDAHPSKEVPITVTKPYKISNPEEIFSKTPPGKSSIDNNYDKSAATVTYADYDSDDKKRAFTGRSSLTEKVLRVQSPEKGILKASSDNSSQDVSRRELSLVVRDATKLSPPAQKARTEGKSVRFSPIEEATSPVPDYTKALVLQSPGKDARFPVKSYHERDDWSQNDADDDWGDFSAIEDKANRERALTKAHDFAARARHRVHEREQIAGATERKGPRETANRRRSISTTYSRNTDSKALVVVEHSQRTRSSTERGRLERESRTHEEPDLCSRNSSSDSAVQKGAGGSLVRYNSNPFAKQDQDEDEIDELLREWTTIL